MGDQGADDSTYENDALEAFELERELAKAATKNDSNTSDDEGTNELERNSEEEDADDSKLYRVTTLKDLQLEMDQSNLTEPHVQVRIRILQRIS